MRDVRHCLRKNGLRLPTAEELDAAKTAGFWVELPDQRSKNLRVATELAPLEAILYLHELRGSRDGFFPWARMEVLGDLLKKTEVEVRELWREYIINSHVRGNAESRAALSEGWLELLCTEATMMADEVVRWVAAAGLKFAA